MLNSSAKVSNIRAVAMPVSRLQTTLNVKCVSKNGDR
jgi:hypothetical protein